MNVTNNQLNVLGEVLLPCSKDPLTGYFRDGYCHTCHEDSGIHTVCALMDETFLDFSMRAGNDLSTPRPEFGFSGVKAGDFWCLCAGRWLEAYKNNCAPKVSLRATNEETLAVIPLEILRKFAIDSE